MALSTPISLTTVRDFFGSSSNNLTALHRGENNIINVASTYGSSTTGLGSVHYAGDGNPIYTGSNYLANVSPYGSHTPHAEYQYGGVCPSLSTANNGIADSGSIDLTDYVGAYRKVNPTASYVGTPTSQGSHTGTYRGVSSPITNPMAYKSFTGINYETLNANTSISNVSISTYCQLLTMQSLQYDAGSAGSMTVNFTLSHAGIYTLYMSITGSVGSFGSHFVNVSGTGVSIYDHVGVQHTAGQNITLNGYHNTAFHRFFEIHHTNTSATITMSCGGTGGATFAQIRTNTNYLRAINTSNTTKYNDMMTQS